MPYTRNMVFPKGMKVALRWLFRFFTSLRIEIYIYIIFYMKKLYKSSIIKNHKITKKNFFDGVPLKGYVDSEVISRFCTKNKKCIMGISSD